MRRTSPSTSDEITEVVQQAAVGFRGLLGLGLILIPRTVLRCAGSRDATTAAVCAARVLGGRHVVEAAGLTLWPGQRSYAVVIAVDTLHASSMLGLAVLSPLARREAAVSCGIATVLGLVGVVTFPERNAVRGRR